MEARRKKNTFRYAGHFTQAVVDGNGSKAVVSGMIKAMLHTRCKTVQKPYTRLYTL